MDLVQTVMKPVEPIVYPIINLGMTTLRKSMGVVRGTNSMILYVVSTVLSPILSILPQSSEHTPLEDPETTPKSNLSLYDEMDSMLTTSQLIYTYVRLRNEAKDFLYGDTEENEGFQKRFGLKKKKMVALENQWKLVKDIEAKISEGEGQANLPMAEITALKVKYFDAQQDLKNLFCTVSPDISDEEMYNVQKNFALLSLPKTAKNVLDDFKNNSERIKTFIELFGSGELNTKAIQKLLEAGNDGQLLCLDDDFSSTEMFGNKTELTWAITINHKLKRITVIFRGSCVFRDFIIDGTLHTKPLYLNGVKSEKPLGNVHTGFYDYLYEKTQRGSDERDISKSEAIMGKLHELFGQYKDYRLYVTGHSLGAALSTLFAFRAADNAGIPNKPVINVSFASPFVGDQKFRDEFQKREIMGLIRHVRVSNEDDAVPLVPPCTLPFLVPYKHVGLNICLYNPVWWRNINYEITFPKPYDLMDEVGRAIKNNILLGLEPFTLFNHLCPEYRSRLDNSAEKLKKYDIETLYHDPYYTGEVAASIRNPKSAVAIKLLIK
jgi:hypothetical protein